MAICQYCKSEIADDAVICPHCRKRTPAAGPGPVPKVIGGAFVALVVLVVLLTISQALNPTKPLPERIKAACQKQYPYSYDQQTSCELALTVSVVEADNQSRLDAAARGAGLR